jgi:hypothetical protein
MRRRIASRNFFSLFFKGLSKNKYIGKYYTHIVTENRKLKGVFINKKKSASGASLRPQKPFLPTFEANISVDTKSHLKGLLHVNQGPRGLIEKTSDQKSRDTAPLIFITESKART